LIRNSDALTAVWVFAWCAKWAILAGGLAYLTLYWFIGPPFTLRRQLVVVCSTILLAAVGPVLLFDVTWRGGPMGAEMSVWPTLYQDMRPLFALCGVVFLLFYNLAFFVFPSPESECHDNANL